MKRILSLLLVLLISTAAFAQKKPVVGISANWGGGINTSVSLNYVKSVMRAGGVPIVLPLTDDKELLARMLDCCDALIMTGGEDFDPLKWYGEKPIPELGKVVPERDDFDMALVKLAIDRGMPILGICRGHQLLNVACGGTLYQDIPSQVKSSNIKHRQTAPIYQGTHSITIEEGSLLNKQIGVKEVSVNSLHHQSVKDLAPGFKITARSSDGIVEAMEMTDNDRIFGVQFHPEGFTANGKDTFLGVFTYLVEKANEYAAKKK